MSQTPNNAKPYDLDAITALRAEQLDLNTGRATFRKRSHSHGQSSISKGAGFRPGDLEREAMAPESPAGDRLRDVARIGRAVDQAAGLCRPFITVGA